MDGGISLFARIAKRLAQPVDAASLVYFRITLGLTIAWEMGRYWLAGWAGRYWVDPVFLFTYWPFDGWVVPLSSLGMSCVLAGIAAAGIGIAVGYRYHLSGAIASLGLIYLFVLDQATYLNHFYLLCLLTVIATCLPVAGTFSLDARRGAVARTSTVPTWALWLVLFQLAVPYIGGGVAKINSDWLAGEPMRGWLGERLDFPLIGAWFGDEWMVFAMAIGGLLLDLCAPFLLLHERTRRWACLVLVVFHTVNSRLFRIGVFPWLMIVTAAVFFAPDWPRRMWRDIKGERPRELFALIGGFGFGFALSSSFPQTESATQAVFGGLGWGICAWHLLRRDEPAMDGEATTGPAPEAEPVPRLGILLLALWVSIQLALPLRHFVIKGNVHWTEEGHNFAWHMKLRSKSGQAAFYIEESGAQWVRVDLDDHLSKLQQRKMATRPTLIVQFAHHLADSWEAEHGVRPRVRARVRCRLNSRDHQPLIDPEVDLAAVPWPVPSGASFILALETPLTPR